MDRERAIILEFQPKIDAELARIGCIEESPHPGSPPDTVPFIGMDRPFTRESMADLVATLREIPSGVGWRGLFSHFGIDPTALDDSAASPTT